MPPTGPGISLHVKITVAPENVEKFLEALKPAYDAVVAEPECTFFQVLHNQDEPGVFKFVENWDADLEWIMNVRNFSPLWPHTLIVASPSLTPKSGY
jgi:hypothetical protein